MAYTTKYRILFADRDGIEYRGDLQYDGYVGSITELSGSGQTCLIDYSMDNKFTPINGSGCTLMFLNDGTVDAEDLFAIGIYDIRLVIERNQLGWNRIWSGYVNTEAFEEDYTWDEGEISITANDGLNAIEREKYFSGTDVDDAGLVIKPWALGTDTITNVIANCISNFDIARVFTIVDVAGSVSDFDSLSVDLSNYVDEDGESMSKREVLQSILEPLTLRIYSFGYATWIVDPCILGITAANTPYKAYSKTMVRAVVDDGIYDKYMNISGQQEVTFLDGNQSMRLNGGLETFVSNYSAYPDTKKIVPYNPSEITILSPVWSSAVNFTNKDGSYWYLTNQLQTYTDFGLTQSTNGFMSSYYEGDTAPINPEDGLYGLAITNSFNEGLSVAPNEDTLIISGGYLPATTDTITLQFEVTLANYTTVAYPITGVELPIRVKIGNKWASRSFYNILTMDGTSESTITVRSNRTENAQENKAVFVLEISGITEGGRFQLEFGRNTSFRTSSDGGQTFNWGTYVGTLFNDCVVFIHDITTTINGTEVNEDDVEYKTESGVDFLKSESVEINNSSRRVNGCLDRGAFVNSNGEHETFFSRTSFPQSGSIGLTMAKGVMANYEVPFRTLNATLRGDALLKNTTSYSYQPDGIFNPISVIQDTANLGSKKFLFAGGEIDLIEKTFSGSWDEIFDANYTITETT